MDHGSMEPRQPRERLGEEVGAGGLERSLVTVAPARWTRLLFLAVVLPTVLALAWAVQWGAFDFTCERAEVGAALACRFDARQAWRHDEARLSLRHPVISIDGTGSGRTSTTVVRIDDAATGATFRTASVPGVVVDAVAELRVCLADSTRLHCASRKSNLDRVLLGWAVVSAICVVLFLVPAASGVLLVANRARRDLRVVRTLGPFRRRPLTFGAHHVLEIDVLQGEGGKRASIVKLIVDGQTRVPLGGHADAAKAAALASEASALVEWLRGGALESPATPAAARSRSAWVATRKVLRPGVAPLHETEARASQRTLKASLGASVIGFGSIAALVSAVAPEALLPLLGLLAAISLPILALILHSRHRLEARRAVALEITTEGVSRMTKAGERRLVRWSEIATVKEHVWPGRWVFRGAGGEALFTTHSVTGDDAPMSRALIAAARAGRLPDDGSSAQIEIGAAPGWAIAFIAGPALCLFGAFFAFTTYLDSTPPLAELTHRIGRVEWIEGIRTLHLEVENDDFAFYVVRGDEHAASVAAAVHVGDEVEIWHDRSERSFGPVGAIFELRTRGTVIVDRDEYAQREEYVALRGRALGIAAAAVGLAILLVAIIAQSRRAVVRIAG